MTRIFIFFFLISFQLQAQRYNTALGLRFGNNHYGITAKQRILGRTTVEGLLMVDPDQYSGTGLLQQHFPLIGRGLNIYIGGGAHLGRQMEVGRFHGFDLVLGAELKAPALPLLISADVKPAYHLNHSEWFDFSTAISAHYIIGKDTKKKRDRARKKKQRQKKKEKEQKRKAREKNKRAREKAGEGSFWDFLKRDETGG